MKKALIAFLFTEPSRREEVEETDEKTDNIPPDEVDLDNFFKDIHRDSSASAEKILANLKLARIIHTNNEVSNKSLSVR